MVKAEQKYPLVQQGEGIARSAAQAGPHLWYRTAGLEAVQRRVIQTK